MSQMNAARALAVVAGGLWPQLTPQTGEAFMQLAKGGLPDPNRYVVVNSNYYHRQAYGTAGANQLTFFNTQYTDGTCNLQGNTVPTERPMLLQNVRLTVQDVDVAGARIAAGSAFLWSATASATSPSPFLRAEEIRTILQAGRVTIRVGDLEIVNAFGLTRFPSGGGINADATSATNAAATGAYLGANVNNGIPAVFNQYTFAYPVPILPGVPITFQINWGTLLTATTAGFTLMAELAGPSLIPLASR